MFNVASVLRTPVVVVLLVASAELGCGPARPQAGGKVGTEGTGGAASSDGGTEGGRNPTATVDGARDQGGAISTGTNMAGCVSSGGSSVGSNVSATGGSDGGTKTIPASADAGDANGSAGGGAGGGGGGRAGSGGSMGANGDGGGVGAAGSTGGGDAGTPKQMRDGAADQAVDATPAEGGTNAGSDGGGAGQPTADAAGTSSDGDASDLGGGSADDLIPRPGELELVELLINPTGTDTGREWIEILNRSERRLSLAQLYIADAANEAAVEFSPNDGEIGATTEPVLEPGARAVLIQSRDVMKNGGVNPGARDLAGTFGTLVSLNNESETISLCRGTCATGVTLAKIAWDVNLGAAYDGHALSIDEAGRRCPASAPFGDGGSFGTPFAANPPCP